MGDIGRIIDEQPDLLIIARRNQYQNYNAPMQLSLNAPTNNLQHYQTKIQHTPMITPARTLAITPLGQANTNAEDDWCTMMMRILQKQRDILTRHFELREQRNQRYQFLDLLEKFKLL